MTHEEDTELTQPTIITLTRMATNFGGSARVSDFASSQRHFSFLWQKDYDEDFLKSKLTLTEYIHRLQLWRVKYEKYLNCRPRIQSMESVSHYLTEFQFGKFDEIEVPGQYTEVSEKKYA